MKPLVLALGSECNGDDAAALIAAETLATRTPWAEIRPAGRPGPTLLLLLDPQRPTLLLDATRSGNTPGTILVLPLSELAERTEARRTTSSHGFGPAESLELGRSLGRKMPPGFFVGVEGAGFQVGDDLSEAVRMALPEFVEQAERLLRGWRDA